MTHLLQCPFARWPAANMHQSIPSRKCCKQFVMINLSLEHFSRRWWTTGLAQPVSCTVDDYKIYFVFCVYSKVDLRWDWNHSSPPSTNFLHVLDINILTNMKTLPMSLQHPRKNTSGHLRNIWEISFKSNLLRSLRHLLHWNCFLGRP